MRIMYHHRMTPLQQYSNMFQNMNPYYLSMFDKNTYYDAFKKDNPYYEYLKSLPAYSGYSEYSKLYI